MLAPCADPESPDGASSAPDLDALVGLAAGPEAAIDGQLKAAHWRRLRLMFSTGGRPTLVAQLSVVDLDLLACGYMRQVDGGERERQVMVGVKIALTDAGQDALKRRLDQHRAVCGVHHTLASRLAFWLRESRQSMTWENVLFTRDWSARNAIDDVHGWTQVRPDVIACALTPTARLAKLETFEVKVSVADFRADLAKPNKVQAARDIAEASWYCTPEGMVTPDMLPEGFGLLWETSPGNFKVARRPKRKKGFIPHRDTLMTLVLRRPVLPEKEALL